MIPVLRPEPDLRARVWGGSRLGPADHGQPIGEAWVAGPTSRVPWPAPAGGAAGRSATRRGATLDELAAQTGRDLVGTSSPWPDRFPLLLKLLDPADWLSVQVHPDDSLAIRLAGPAAVGKTEAWFVLDAEPDAELLAGVRPGVAADRVRAAIRTGGLPDLLEHLKVTAGDTILVPAGTLHSIGPGLLLYELQQPSDLTYRADDWGRPPTPERPLHVDETLAAWKPEAHAVRGHEPLPAAGGRAILVACDHFVMERLYAPGREAVALDPAGRSPHILTALPGSIVALAGNGWTETIGPLETAVVAAAAGPYRASAGEGASIGAALLARLPD